MLKSNKNEDVIKYLRAKDRTQKIYYSDIPEEYREDKKSIIAQRKYGIRKIDKIGFDVINQVYFVHEFVLDYNELRKEEVWKENIKTFAGFNDYYNYLEGKIYENACYYQCDLSAIEKNIDKSKMSEKTSFVEDSIDKYTISPSEDELLQYSKGEKRKKQLKKWVSKFIACDSLASLQKVVESYEKSVLYTKFDIDVDLLFWQYIFYDLKDKNRFKVIMEYMSTGYYPEHSLIKPLCHVYNPEEILLNYNYLSGKKSACDKHKRDLRKYIEDMDKNGAKPETVVFFDKETHYYCEKSSFGVCRFFETFDDLLKYRRNDLSNADLIDDIKLNYDFSKCKMNINTKLPISSLDEVKYTIKKTYSDGKFKVLQKWYNKNDLLIKRYLHEFDYFFDFASFLKGDLSNADLVLCKGLINLKDISGINFSNAGIISAFCDKFGIKYNKFNIDLKKIETFARTEECEQNTTLALNTSRELDVLREGLEPRFSNSYFNNEHISYISDLHLMHKLQHFAAKSKDDVLCVVKSIVNNIVEETKGILLIGGDVSSDYSIFELFVRLLRDELYRKRKDSKVIFVLGNHELWDFFGISFNKIVEKYEKLITECGMYFLQNNIIYKNSERKICKISTVELESLPEKEIREKLRDVRLILFGGLAFSGCNNEFNAENGIYRKTIDRDEEIRQSKYFEELYNKVVSTLPDRRLVIFTHTPIDCWQKNSDYHKDYVYVSGHTHKNQFYDDGAIRIYADNQVGYANNSPHLKCFDLDNEYDYFSDFADGIYEISADDYKRFYRGKNLSITFNREVNILYMLKKSGHYCFVHKSKNGSLLILNGGAVKTLNQRDINYYYNNMDSAIATIKGPLEKYTSVQKKIAHEIRKIGGSGTIHGCIIDIDWYNHIYVNPVDLKITGYWAEDIIYKKVYPSVLALLKSECPLMYDNYKRLSNGGSNELPILTKNKRTGLSVLPQTYLNTDIYKASREIKKMQKLSSSILTTWYEINNEHRMIESKI